MGEDKYIALVLSSGCKIAPFGPERLADICSDFFKKDMTVRVETLSDSLLMYGAFDSDIKYRFGIC